MICDQNRVKIEHPSTYKTNSVLNGTVYINAFCLGHVLLRLCLWKGIVQSASLAAKNLLEIVKKSGKRGKIGKKRQTSGGFFHFAPPDR